MAETDSARTDELPEGLPLGVVHDELIRIEAHWTAQVQNQQTRILAILTVNSFALAFLTAAGFRSTGHGTGFELFGASLIVLTVALIVGVGGLIPNIGLERDDVKVDDPPGVSRAKPLWFDSYAVWSDERRRRPTGHSRLLGKLCESIAKNQNWNRKHGEDASFRRRVMTFSSGSSWLDCSSSSRPSDTGSDDRAGRSYASPPSSGSAGWRRDQCHQLISAPRMRMFVIR